MTPNRTDRIAALKATMGKRVLVMDGAMGTLIQNQNLKAADFGGAELEGCNEHLVLTRPDLIEDLHLQYFAAGADIAETNTFGATPVVLAEYGLSHKTHEINVAAGKLARQAADRQTARDGQPRWVAGSIGPTTKAISVTGGVTFQELIQNFRDQALGLIEGDVDYLLIETSQDTRNVKAALIGCEEAFEKTGTRLPVAVSGTIEPMGTMLAGQTVESLVTSLEHADLFYIGLNCATGPEFMTDHIRTLAGLSPFPVGCVPNAGLPDENGVYLESPAMLARTLKRFCEEGWLNVLGGCCGTQPAHIKAIAEAVVGQKPRHFIPTRKSTLSGVDPLDVTEEMRPVIVGERTNVIGSRKFKELIVAEQWEDASEVARAQVKRGAQVIDICLANPDREELQDFERFINAVVKKVRVPLMIDSTDEKVIAMALTYSQGKAIINSVNMEDGEERFEKVVPLARRFGAALVVGCIDEVGMAVTRDQKLKVAQASFELLTGKYGMRAEDIYFDPLVFPCASGDKQYVGSAVETIEGVRLIKKHLPLCKTVLGISNVSFGLPTAGREVLNSVFLYHCTQAGLDMALVNSEKLERYASLPEAEKALSEDLLFNRGVDPVTPFAAHFRERRPMMAEKSTLPLEERLPRYIIEGSRDGLIKDLDLALEKLKPLEVINGPLMKGMDEVGRLFGNNELIVAEVLQSAEVMKLAVSYLEPKMDKSATAVRGKIVLATVKGDVHDIGKNLVEIILANNGFQVVNLGIKIPPAQLVEAVKTHKPDILGLSGLLVKSAHQMVTTAEDLSRAGVNIPILVGGAALSRNFVDRNIAPAYSGTVAYAQDAMSGLELAKRIVEPAQHKLLQGELQVRREKLARETSVRPAQVTVSSVRSKEVRVVASAPQPSDFARHVITNTPVDQIWRFINPVMLYGRHLGLRASARALGTAQEAELHKTEEGRKALELKARVDELKETLRHGEMKPRAVFRFFKAGSQGNSVLLFDGESNAPITRFEFPRQEREGGLCLADFVIPLPEGGLPRDNLAMFVVTAGDGIRELSERYKANGDFVKMHTVQALALETAEAFAELMHSQLRSMWGSPDRPDMTMLERFRAEYSGKRYSFGYPACPRLEDQQPLFAALKPEEVGVQLTDGCMMEPEASVSALVLHHPDASYFSVT